LGIFRLNLMGDYQLVKRLYLFISLHARA